MKLKPFAFITISHLYILIHFIIICFIIKMHCKRQLQMQKYTASLQRARGAPKTPTALPQRAV